MTLLCLSIAFRLASVNADVPGPSPLLSPMTACSQRVAGVCLSTTDDADTAASQAAPALQTQPLPDGLVLISWSMGMYGQCTAFNETSGEWRNTTTLPYRKPRRDGFCFQCGWLSRCCCLSQAVRCVASHLAAGCPSHGCATAQNLPTHGMLLLLPLPLLPIAPPRQAAPGSAAPRCRTSTPQPTPFAPTLPRRPPSSWRR